MIHDKKYSREYSTHVESIEPEYCTYNHLSTYPGHCKMFMRYSKVSLTFCDPGSASELF